MDASQIMMMPQSPSGATLPGVGAPAGPAASEASANSFGSLMGQHLSGMGLGRFSQGTGAAKSSVSNAQGAAQKQETATEPSNSSSVGINVMLAGQLATYYAQLMASQGNISVTSQLADNGTAVAPAVGATAVADVGMAGTVSSNTGLSSIGSAIPATAVLGAKAADSAVKVSEQQVEGADAAAGLKTIALESFATEEGQAQKAAVDGVVLGDGKNAKTPVDTTKATVDIAQVPVDTAKAPVDTAKAPVDTAKAPVDTAKAPADTTTVPVDTAKVPADTTTAPVDTAKVPVDTAKVPVDTAKASELLPRESAQAQLVGNPKTTTAVVEQHVRFAERPDVVEAAAQSYQQSSSNNTSDHSEMPAEERFAGLALKSEENGVAGDTDSLSGTTLPVNMQHASSIQGMRQLQGAEAAGTLETTSSYSPEQVARQVAERLTGHDLKQGSEQITLKLSPEHLGNVQLHLRMDDQSLKLQIVAEHRSVRDALLQQADSLKETLAKQNIKMDSFDVTTGNGGNQPQQFQNWRQTEANQQQVLPRYASVTRGSSLPDKLGTQMRYFTPQYQSTIDVRF